MKQGRKWFWGILFILGAVALLAGAMGYMKEFGFWTIFVSIVLAGWMMEGIYKRSFGMVLFPIALLVIINRKWIGIPEVSPWYIILAAVLATVGLTILFPNVRRKKKQYSSFYTNGSSEEYVHAGIEGEEIRCEVSFHEAVKYVNSGTFSRLHTECSFGSLKIYFDNGALKNGVAEAYAETSFGSTIYYVPSTWRVVMNVNSAFGSSEEKGRCNPLGENTLYVSGDVSFGSVVIQYI